MAGSLRSGACAAALGAAALLTLLAAPPASAQAPAPPSLTISPSKVEATAREGLVAGPFSFTNATEDPYRVRVIPVELAQDREGGITIAEEKPSLRRARRALSPSLRSFRSDPGAAESVSATLERVPDSGSFFGGLLFEATPRGVDPDQQLVEILRLNGSLLFNPPPGAREVALGAEEVRAEQDGERIQLLAPATNEGNVYMPAGGAVRIRDASEEVVARERLRWTKMLPGATVDLAAPVSADLGAGTYELEAKLEMGRKSVEASGSMELVATNELAFADAEIADFPAPDATRGEPVDLEASFSNTGNVAWAPRAVVDIRPIGAEGIEKVIDTQEVEVAEAPAGEEGTVSGELTLPEGSDAFELQLRLLDGERTIDHLATSVTPAEPRGLFAGLFDFVKGNALLIVGVLVILLLFGAVATLAYVRRLRIEAAGGGGPSA